MLIRLKMESYCKNIMYVLIFLPSFPKPVAATVNAGPILANLALVIGVVILIACCCGCFRRCCCRRNGSKSIGVSTAVVNRKESQNIVRAKPQFKVIASREKYDYVQTHRGAGIVNTRVVADDDGNVAARQSVYVIT